MYKVRNKNVIIDLLKDSIKLEKICIVQNLKEDEQTKEIIELATTQNIKIERLPQGRMEKGRTTDHREVLIAYIQKPIQKDLQTVTDEVYKKNEKPFFLILNRVAYENNIGVITRTAYAAGVNGIIFQTPYEQFFNDETIHYSMGTITKIPLIKMNIFQAIKELKKDGVKVLSLQMGGQDYYETDLTGSVAFILGSESKGVSDTLSSKCDQTISIPMQKGIESLNVGVSAGIVIYEKLRQEQG